MKIYLAGTGYKNGTRAIAVQPGNHLEDPRWFVDDGHGRPIRTQPILFRVQFIDGMAEVDRELGEYMIEKGHAQGEPNVVPGIAPGSDAGDPNRAESYGFAPVASPARTMRIYTPAGVTTTKVDESGHTTTTHVQSGNAAKTESEQAVARGVVDKVRAALGL